MVHDRYCPTLLCCTLWSGLLLFTHLPLISPKVWLLYGLKRERSLG